MSKLDKSSNADDYTSGEQISEAANFFTFRPLTAEK